MSYAAENARLNDVAHRCSTTKLEWGNAEDIDSLTRAIGQPIGLVIGSDIAYSLESLPCLVDTIRAFNPRQTILSVRPRHLEDESSREVAELTKLAAKAGFSVEEVGREVAINTHLS